ncbi:MAG: nucleotide exchange factor GrpE [Eubacterium sp.]|jgi:molecular chaperone GrpE|nr:nucleotide exchange factor GrpE [Eubacterium sp.]MCH4046444.1 nucleotide exchange factor GrpE [Eubacterium sp.]MCH4079539.1 nucleotide exchange factor GrpE [Eubacterium sp.]MCH4111119.1 nucleotide exchange factor GrpE [Eubacterium sp.]MCI1307377.1 nucleotide exchange factor GrpE [Eubacterium sp.]
MSEEKMKEAEEKDPKQNQNTEDQGSDTSDEKAAETSSENAEKDADQKEAENESGKSDEQKDADKKEDKAADAEEDQNDKYIRLMADFQNYKRRVEKEKSEIYDYANQKILAELLTVLDNFERALAQDCADEAYEKGMSMIFKQFREVLEKSGLEEIEALGKDFDPNFHHAVMTDNNDDYESGQVTGVLQKGYKLHGKVVRPAMVKVNQ